jgi:hypothetical protein
MLCGRYCRQTLILLFLCLTACGTTRLAIPEGRELAISVTTEKSMPEGIGISNEVLKRDASMGVKSGAAFGGLLGTYGAGACALAGPAAALCVPAVILVSAGVFGAAGAAVGAGVGLIEGWTQEHADQLKVRLAQYRAANSPIAELTAELQAGTATRWKLGNGPGATVIQVTVYQLAVHMLRGEQAALGIRAKVTFETPGHRRDRTWALRWYELAEPEVPAREWINASDETIAEHLRAVHRQLVDAIVTEMWPN